MSGVGEVRCRWVASDQARVLSGRHEDDCEDESCRGCLPCPMDHCRVCGVEHANTCPGCLSEARENLNDIRRMCRALPEEAELRGVDGEAAMLLGPAADPEAWGHREASARAGRIPADYLEVARDEAHPLWVLGTWSMVYRDAFDHDEPTARVDVYTEAGYLERNLGYAGDFKHVPFEDFARDLRRCVAHLEAVLHDSERGERTNIDCLDCGGALERQLGTKGFDDRATCRGCNRRLTWPEYLLAVKRTYIEHATWLNDSDMAIRTGILADTVRSWARAPKDGSAPLVRKEIQLGRTVYLVTDVETTAAAKGLAPCA